MPSQTIVASRQTALRAAIAATVASGVLLVGGCNADPTPDVLTESSRAAHPAPAAGADQLPATRETAESTPADSELASKVETALAAEPDLHGSPIGVQATDGVVTLTGSTKDALLRSMAAAVALSIDGVRLVKNELAISVQA